MKKYIKYILLLITLLVTNITVNASDLPKLYITGKGKCNLTNNSSVENHLEHIITNSKFMYRKI